MTTEHVNILLVEDNVVDATRCSRALEKNTNITFDLVHVSTLASATDCLEEGNIDIILLDLVLPDSQGLDTLQATRSCAPEVPVIILTSIDDEDIAINAVKHGAQDYLVKSQINSTLLIRAIRYTIERYNLLLRLNHASRLGAIGHLAAAVAHEINNPAAYIMMNLCRMKELVEQKGVDHKELSPLDAELLEMINENHEGIERICAITKDLRTFSRIEKDHIETANINKVIDSSYKLVANDIRHRARFVTRYGQIPPIPMDRVKISQVITNILINAAHAIPEGASKQNEIRVETQCANDQLVINISDTGCGMPEHIKKRVFEPFYTTKPKGKGTGLGLSLCAEIVRKHGGEINIESKENEGTCFSVTLPINPETHLH